MQIHNLQNEITKRCPPPDSSVSGLFYAGTGLLLCRCDEKVILFDVQQRTAVSELQAAGVKYVVWNSSSTLVALLSKHNVVVADAKLGSAATVHETIRVKSAAWTDNGVLIYTTLNHIKYCMPGGDSGIVKTLDQPVYIFAVVGEVVHALDRDGKALTIPVRTFRGMCLGPGSPRLRRRYPGTQLSGQHCCTWGAVDTGGFVSLVLVRSAGGECRISGWHCVSVRCAWPCMPGLEYVPLHQAS